MKFRLKNFSLNFTFSSFFQSFSLSFSSLSLELLMKVNLFQKFINNYFTDTLFPNEETKKFCVTIIIYYAHARVVVSLVSTETRNTVCGAHRQVFVKSLSSLKQKLNSRICSNDLPSFVFGFKDKQNLCFPSCLFNFSSTFSLYFSNKCWRFKRSKKVLTQLDFAHTSLIVFLLFFACSVLISSVALYFTMTFFVKPRRVVVMDTHNAIACEKFKKLFVLSRL